jgi:hypothetical protein
MEPNRFDTLTRSITTTGSRRGAVATLLAGTLGLLGLADAAAKKKGGGGGGGGGGGKKGKGNGKGNGKKKDGNPTTVATTCSDGIKNGDESDVDCGGSCPRCASGKTCASRDDCESALCPGGTCIECLKGGGSCGGEAGGLCICEPTANYGAMLCSSRRTTAGGVFSTCAACSPGSNCLDADPGTVTCHKPCGAP